MTHICFSCMSFESLIQYDRDILFTKRFLFADYMKVNLWVLKTG